MKFTRPSELPKYERVNCQFYDKLLDHATIGQKVQLVILANNEQKMVEGIIQDVFTTSDGEYLRLDNALEVRLDFILEVNVC